MSIERSLALYRRMPSSLICSARPLLSLLPREFRNENGEEMERLFAEALVDARAKTPGATLRAWWGASWDVAFAAALSRLAPRSRRTGSSGLRSSGPILPSQKPKDGLVFESLPSVAADHAAVSVSGNSCTSETCCTDLAKLEAMP